MYPDKPVMFENDQITPCKYFEHDYPESALLVYRDGPDLSLYLIPKYALEGERLRILEILHGVFMRPNNKPKHKRAFMKLDAALGIKVRPEYAYLKGVFKKYFIGNSKAHIRNAYITDIFITGVVSGQIENCDNYLTLQKTDDYLCLKI